MHNFFQTTSIHGMKYITEKDRSLLERVTWIALIFMATWVMVLVVSGSYDSYKNHAISFVVDTAYLKWNTDFPAISVCEMESSDKIDIVSERLYGKDRNMNIDLFLKDIAFFDGTCRSCDSHCTNGEINCTNDFDLVVKEIRSTCPDLIDSCRWNMETIDCCEYFRPLQTEIGPCFTFNSAIDTTSTQKTEKLDLPLMKSKNLQPPRRKRNFYSNRKTGPGTLTFKTKEVVMLYLHSQYDVPYANHPLSERAKIEWNRGLLLEFQVKEIANDEGVQDLAVWQRRCRFPSEQPDNSQLLYEQYSYSTCIVECHAAAQLKMCNCTDHFIPTPPDWNKTCTVEGLACLTKYQRDLRSLRTEWNNKAGLVCDCDTGCLEPEFSIVEKKIFSSDSATPDKLMVKVKMSALPSERFRRSVVRTKLDLIVSVGGTAGLCLGASILSAVEIIYHIFINIVPLFRKPLSCQPKKSSPQKLRKKRKCKISDKTFSM